MLKSIFLIAKVAFQTVLSDHKAQLNPPVIYDLVSKNNTNRIRYQKTKSEKRETKTYEKKVHEFVTLLSQLIISILSLIKLIRACFPNKIWRSPHQ